MSSNSSILHPSPWSVEYIQPQLHAYRRSNDHDHADQQKILVSCQIEPDQAAQLLQDNGFLSRTRLTFVVHGFRNNVEASWMTQIKDELLKESDQAVLLVDWGNGADLMAARYLQAAANIQTVGAWLASHVSALKNLKPGLEIWAIGHSLGCHLLGIAGRKSGKLERISAMDPAGPGFEKHEFLPYRLSPTDAKMVDVIHTDGYDSFLDPEDWISPVNHYGTLIPLGTIDFYPNYGYDQPGAGPVSSHLIAASHLRAIDLFIWSITNPQEFQTNQVLDGIPAFESPVKEVKEVERVAEMGYYAYKSPSKEGIYFLQTNSEEPWTNKKEKENPTDNSSYCLIT